MIAKAGNPAEASQQNGACSRSENASRQTFGVKAFIVQRAVNDPSSATRPRGTRGLQLEHAGRFAPGVWWAPRQCELSCAAGNCDSVSAMESRIRRKNSSLASRIGAGESLRK